MMLYSRFVFPDGVLLLNPDDISTEAELEEGFSDDGWRRWKPTGWHKITIGHRRESTQLKAQRIPVGTRGTLSLAEFGSLGPEPMDVEFRGFKQPIAFRSRRRRELYFRGRKAS